MSNEALRRMRVDQVGSFLRPEELKAAFLRHARGQMSFDDLVARQDEAVEAIVARQVAAGLPFVTDGEYRRLNWQVSFSEVEGWDLWPGAWANFLKMPDNLGEGERPNARGADAVEAFKIPARGKVRLVDSFPAKELAFVKGRTKHPVKVTLMGPDRVTQMCDIPGSKPHYSDAEEFLVDVTAVARQIAEGLVAGGCDYLQIDEPSFTGYVDPATLARIKARGEDPLKNLERAIRADNAVIAGLAGKCVTGLHICRGNRASMWHREGAYDGIAEMVFGELRYDRLLLEYDTARAGGFEPLRHVAKGAMVVLGLLTTKTGTPETVESLKRRLDEASRFIDLDQVALSPQCGFASGIGGNALSEGEQWRKIEVMLETAHAVWGST